MNPAGTSHVCVFGLGWGDEGKGKVVDLLCAAFDIVVRFNGGANAGHTVCVGEDRFALHLLPIGVLHEGKVGVIGPGVVADPLQLLQEIDALQARGIDVLSRLKISDRAHLVLPYHKVEDRLSERAAVDASRIGTTARGIGPCYADKAKRMSAVRFADLLHDRRLAERLRQIATQRKVLFQALYGEDGGLDVEAMIAEIGQAGERLRSRIGDTTAWLHDALQAGKSILFEGANGVLLDQNHGTYPFVTSSSTGPHGIGPGAGVPAEVVAHRVGVTKAYATRVGAGPFVSELTGAVGEQIRRQGNEFGTTTGRPRRCGWFDAVACRYAVRVSGATEIALMHLDTLRGLDPVGICVGYRWQGRVLDTVPAYVGILDEAEPVVEYQPGWEEDLQGVRTFDDLPSPARGYVDRLEALIGVPISIVGVGPQRSQTLIRSSWFSADCSSEATLASRCHG